MTRDERFVWRLLLSLVLACGVLGWAVTEPVWGGTSPRRPLRTGARPRVA